MSQGETTRPGVELVADHLAQIGAVAEALAREGKLDRSQIDALTAEVAP